MVTRFGSGGKPSGKKCPGFVMYPLLLKPNKILTFTIVLIGHQINLRKLFPTYFIVLIGVCSFLTHFSVSQSGSDRVVHHYFNIWEGLG